MFDTGTVGELVLIMMKFAKVCGLGGCFMVKFARLSAGGDGKGFADETEMMRRIKNVICMALEDCFAEW